jgi:hypothetical protein
MVLNGRMETPTKTLFGICLSATGYAVCFCWTVNRVGSRRKRKSKAAKQNWKRIASSSHQHQQRNGSCNSCHSGPQSEKGPTDHRRIFSGAHPRASTDCRVAFARSLLRSVAVNRLGQISWLATRQNRSVPSLLTYPSNSRAGLQWVVWASRSSP